MHPGSYLQAVTSLLGRLMSIMLKTPLDLFMLDLKVRFKGVRRAPRMSELCRLVLTIQSLT